MFGVLVTGHGNFASGLLSSMKLIVGRQEKVVGVDFLEEEGTDVLKENIRLALKSLGDEVLVLTDIAGGSPYMNSVMLKQEFENMHIEVISGTNIPMLLEVVLGRSISNLESMIQLAQEAGHNAISVFELTQEKEEIIDEGI